MILADLAATLFNSLAHAMTLFLFASGLALVLGILRILNFAHGGLFMLAAYLTYSTVASIGENQSLMEYVAVAILIMGVLAAVGIVIERVLFNRLRDVDPHYALIGTYALLLLLQGAVKLYWGVNFLAVPVPNELEGALRVGGVAMPWLTVFVLVFGLAFFLVLNHILHNTRFGKLMTCVADDPWMSNALGVNVPLINAAIVIFGIGLAGLTGALLAPTQALTPHFGENLIVPAFGVLIVGGMGNLKGTFFACVVLSVIDGFAATYLGMIQGIAFFAAVSLVLLFRPQGLIPGANL